MGASYAEALGIDVFSDTKRSYRLRYSGHLRRQNSSQASSSWRCHLIRLRITDGRWLALLFLASAGSSPRPSNRKTDTLTAKYHMPIHQLATRIASTTNSKRLRVDDRDL